MTTLDVHGSGTLYNTSQWIVGVFYTIAVGVILIRTATTAIYITTIAIAGTTIDTGIRNTNLSAIDIQYCILEGVTILTTAIDRPLDGRTSGRIFCSNIHLCAIHPSHTVVGVNGRSPVWCSHIATRRTEYHTILLTIPAKGATGNCDIGLTCLCCIQCSRHSRCSIVGKVTH